MRDERPIVGNPIFGYRHGGEPSLQPDDRRLRYICIPAEFLHKLLMMREPKEAEWPLLCVEDEKGYTHQLPDDCRVLGVDWDQHIRCYRVVLWSARFDQIGYLHELPRWNAVQSSTLFKD